MQRTVVVGVIGLIGSAFIFGQSTPAQTRDRRLEEALADISLLKRVVKEQDRRIADLEKASHNPQAAAPAAVEASPRVVPKPVTSPWHSPAAWGRIQDGMPRAQVEEILGKPTSVDAVIDSLTLRYKDDASGTGVLTGSVKLTDDRVSAVSPPGF